MWYKRQFIIGLALLIGPLLTVKSQDRFVVVFRGTSYETNSTGVILSKPMTERTWVQEYAVAAGITNTRSLAVAYHVKGNDLGDTLEVVNLSTGTALATVCGFYFGQDFGRMYLTSKNNLQAKRLDYIYTDQNSHSLGSALISKTFLLDRGGNTNRTLIRGQMQWIVTPRGTDGVKVRTGNFVTAKPLPKP